MQSLLDDLPDCPVDTSVALVSHCLLVDSVCVDFEGPALYSTKEASIAAYSVFSTRQFG